MLKISEKPIASGNIISLSECLLMSKKGGVL